MKFINPVTVTDAVLVSSSRAEDDYSVWSGATTYSQDDRVIYAHRVYQSAANLNTGHDPVTDAEGWWVDIGPTNRWAMFDQVVGTVTEQASEIEVVLAPGAITSVALLDLVGDSVSVSMNSSDGGPEVYAKTKALIEDVPPVTDWWTYYTSSFRQMSSVVLENLPYYSGCRLTATVQSSSVAKCGTMVVGQPVEIGETLSRPEISIIDYSRKETDDYGVTRVVKRSFARRLEADVLLDSSQVDGIADALSDIRATPVVWVGSGVWGAMTIYGWARDWGIVISGPILSEARFTIEGLV